MNEKYLICGAIAGIVILTFGVVWYYRLENQKEVERTRNLKSLFTE